MSRHATLAKRILALLEDGKPRTSTEIAAEIRGSDSKVGLFLRVARTPGEAQQVRALDKGGYKGAVRYVLGKGENVYVRPAPVAAAQLAARADAELTEEQLDAKYRGYGRWWPAADAVVQKSFDAMVRGARA
jgi:hypothetical protein